MTTYGLQSSFFTLLFTYVYCVLYLHLTVLLCYSWAAGPIIWPGMMACKVSTCTPMTSETENHIWLWVDISLSSSCYSELPYHTIQQSCGVAV